VLSILLLILLSFRARDNSCYKLVGLYSYWFSARYELVLLCCLDVEVMVGKET